MKYQDIKGPRFLLKPGTKEPAKLFKSTRLRDTEPKGKPYALRLDNVTGFDIEYKRFTGSKKKFSKLIEKISAECGYVVQTGKDSFHFIFKGEAVRVHQSVKRKGIDCIKSGSTQYFIGEGSKGTFDGVAKEYKLIKNEHLTPCLLYTSPSPRDS